MLRDFSNRCLALIVAALSFTMSSHAAELVQIDAQSRPTVGGKEVDYIDGDFVLSNDKIIAVIGNPIAGRDANMTVRGVGAALIDLTRTDDMSDQLSALYPTGRQFIFADPSLVESGKTDDAVFSVPIKDTENKTVCLWVVGHDKRILVLLSRIAGLQE